ncbi:transposable element p transposase [Plakobranchus ocellatus]|uniref:Transposable element p transposase n=1 Tax=Plakobranchus ocellatus TaxID=259542 RepID=A0AAV4CTB6_9GAST|nr:transposable element p transposase [Plakobranchus ocellatus]
MDDPQCLAKTALGIMISCMFGRPNFLSKILPISRLKSSFLHEQIQLSLAAIAQVGGHVKAIICDGNRNNQAFFQLLGANLQRPWETQAGVYLLYDYVHILKNIRNNWLTEEQESCHIIMMVFGGQQSGITLWNSTSWKQIHW